MKKSDNIVFLSIILVGFCSLLSPLVAGPFSEDEPVIIENLIQAGSEDASVAEEEEEEGAGAENGGGGAVKGEKICDGALLGGGAIVNNSSKTIRYVANRRVLSLGKGSRGGAVTCVDVDGIIIDIDCYFRGKLIKGSDHPFDCVKIGELGTLIITNSKDGKIIVTGGNYYQKQPFGPAVQRQLK
ncbi:MAG: hypothetical protein HQM10_05010 [Candidatus Riflebacteria bacterium]|nr:hypothetical protein [Candidatus Riflebacteria bacterium]